MATDPICEIEVDERTAEVRELVKDVNGVRYFFCSAHCMEQFTVNPGPYTASEPEERATGEGMPAPAE